MIYLVLLSNEWHCVKTVYRNLRVQDFKIRANSNKRKKPATELNGYVIYAPTEQNPSWQVDIAKGKNIPSCGFVQYQYSQKVEQGKKFQRLSKVKIVKNLQKYLVAKESKTLQKADLSWKCESYFHH